MLKLTMGDPAPDFTAITQDRHTLKLSDKAGTPTLLCFYAQDKLTSCQDIALSLKSLSPELTRLHVQIFSISLDTPEDRAAFNATSDLPFTLLSDPSGQVSKRYGVCQENPDESLNYVRTAFLLDSNLRILAIYEAISNLDTFQKILIQDIQTLCPPQPYIPMPMHAPVLMIPNVLSRDFCQKLISVWHTQGNEDSGFMKQGDQGEPIGVINYNNKIRRDHFVRDPELLTQIDGFIRRRVYPEILKCFHFDASRREEYKIACYDGSRGGHFKAHRDNTVSSTAHRVWAMTLNLNAEEYEGGHLRFPEYGPYLYKPETGSAVIFSCSLLHEAMPVTQGVRFVLLSFLYGEKQSEARKAYAERYQEFLDAAPVIVTPTP